jgi:hypothetical protein
VMAKCLCICLHKIHKCHVLRRIGKQGLNPQVTISVISGTSPESVEHSCRSKLSILRVPIYHFISYMNKHPLKAFCLVVL